MANGKHEKGKLSIAQSIQADREAQRVREMREFLARETAKSQ